MRTNSLVTENLRHSVSKHVTIILRLAEFPKHAFVVACASNDAIYRKYTESSWVFLPFHWTKVTNHGMSGSDVNACMRTGAEL